MRFDWRYDGDVPLVLRTFLRQKGLTRSQQSRLKFSGGQILVNGDQTLTNTKIQPADLVTIFLAPEKASEHIQPMVGDLKIVFEDEHLLVIDKPPFIASLPSPQHPQNTIANIVKYHLQQTNASSQAIHTVTRLDRDTSGLMIFTKHSFAHSMLDQQLQNKQLQKTYLALAQDEMSDYPNHAWIKRPIRISEDFYMRREVGPGGKACLTEYVQLARHKQATLLQIRLHTGRTHQIRVHFSSLGHPLIGDDLYGAAANNQLFKRQALHCTRLVFKHPFTNEELVLNSTLPADFSALLQHYQLSFKPEMLKKI